MQFASKLEQRYSVHLNQLVAAGDILYYHYEPLKFILGPGSTYRPDYLVVRPDGKVEIHEVKGYLRDDASVKFRAASSRNTWAVFIMVSWDSKKKSWREMMRFNDGRVNAVGSIVPTTVKDADTPMDASGSLVAKPRQSGFSSAGRYMSYPEMQASPEYARLLSMKPDGLRQLREGIGKTCAEMDQLLGLPYPGVWGKFERGLLKLYHYKHVNALKELLCSSK